MSNNFSKSASLSNYVFFLGGHDLEMLTIKELLIKHGLLYYDKNLSWGAKASSYNDEIEKLTKDQIPVFIELDIDVQIPPNSILIDHHNQKAGKTAKTSIEQIAELLGVELNREQRLISANDRAYIKGMLEMGATDEEIRSIRERDRKAQGVTEEDERLAEISLKHFSHRYSSDLIIVYNLSSKISPIIDRLYCYYRHIFVINLSGELFYSGTGQIVNLLCEKFKKLSLSNQKIIYWYGGNLPDEGYFGSNNVSDGNLIMTKKDIIELMKPFTVEEKIISHHIFMFPFTIETDQISSQNGVENSLKEHEDKFLKTIRDKLKGSIWKYKPFKVLLDIPEEIRTKLIELKDESCSPYSDDEIWTYNEYNYFYEFVQDTLFTRCSEEEIGEVCNPVSLCYEMDISPNDEITFCIKGDIPINYTLKVDNISLRIFETNVGILSITLYNTRYKDYEDIQKINDFGRRIYPQFLGTGSKKEPIDVTKDNFFCDKIIFKAANLNIEEEFKTQDFINIFNNNTKTTYINYAKYIQALLKPLSDNGFVCRSVIDDRMYTICWYGNDEFINRISMVNINEYEYENDEDWYRFIFIDGQSSLVQDKKMRRELIIKSTYSRFVEWKALYGISRYSFVCLTNTSGFAYNILRNHMQKMYYQFSVLLLAQRASIVVFNNKLEKIQFIDLIENLDYNKIEERVKKLEILDSVVLNFINRMTFKEVTPQEQGIELYSLAYENMEIEKNIKLLRQKISDLHITADQILERKNLTEERKRSEIARLRQQLFNKITLVTTIIGPITLFSTLYKLLDIKFKVPKCLSCYLSDKIYNIIWYSLFFIFLYILIYTLINDNYSMMEPKNFNQNKNKSLDFETSRKVWFHPLKTLCQVFFGFNTEKKLKKYKISLLVLFVVLLLGALIGYFV